MLGATPCSRQWGWDQRLAFRQHLTLDATPGPGYPTREACSLQPTSGGWKKVAEAIVDFGSRSHTGGAD
jgi:hypothetical protein